jgi:hypothetical protein
VSGWIRSAHDSGERAHDSGEHAHDCGEHQDCPAVLRFGRLRQVVGVRMRLGGALLPSLPTSGDWLGTI